MTGGHFPKFVLSSSIHRSRTSESYGRQQTKNSGAAFYLKSWYEFAAVVQELQTGGTTS